MKSLLSFLAAFAIIAVFAVPSFGQAPRPPAPARRAPSVPRLDLSVGAGFITASDLGDAKADLRGATGGPVQLFATSSRIGTSVPVEVRLGYRMTPRYSFEIRGAWSQPELQTAISGDFEAAPALTVAEKVNLYSLDFGLLVMFNRSRPDAMTPFISGGAGYAGAVHEGFTLLENGMTYRGGGGIKYPLNRKIGLRLDGTLIFLSGGLVRDFGTTYQAVGSGAVYLTF